MLSGIIRIAVGREMALCGNDLVRVRFCIVLYAGYDYTYIIDYGNDTDHAGC